MLIYLEHREKCISTLPQAITVDPTVGLCMCVGDCALVVWVCAQGDCRSCIFMLYCVHDHCGVIVLIYVTK